MGNNHASLREEQAKELRLGLQESSLIHLLSTLNINSSSGSKVANDLVKMSLTAELNKQMISTLFRHSSNNSSNGSTDDTDNSRSAALSTFANALTDELLRLCRLMTFAAATATAPSDSAPVTFYQFASAVKALVQGGNEQLINTMNRLFEADATFSSLPNRVHLCHDILYSTTTTTNDVITAVTFNGSSLLSNLANTNKDSMFHTMLAVTLRSHLAERCFGDVSHQFPPLPLLRSNILEGEQIFFLSMSMSKILLFDCAGHWDKLYSDVEQGTNFNNFVDALIGYDGPTAIVVRDTKGFTFGVLTRSAWKFSANFFGDGVDTILFQLAPKFQILRPQKRRGAGKNFQWLNTEGYRKDLPAGIGMGGETDYFRFLLNSDLKSCVARSSGLTFDSGSIASSETFDVGTIEIWGFGGEHARNTRQEKKEDERRFQESRRKVDKQQLMDGFTAEYLLGDTFKHRTEQRGGGKSDK